MEFCFFGGAEVVLFFFASPAYRDRRQGANLQLMRNLGIAQRHGRPSLHQESGHFEIAAGERVVERSHAVALGAAGVVDIGAAF